MAVNVTDADAIPRIEDLYLFRDTQPGEAPPAAAGAAMLELIRRRLFPGFALVTYDALSAAGRDHPPPQPLALIAADAILLAPSHAPAGWRGFLIAEGTAAGQPRAFHWPGEADPCCWLDVPVPESAAAVWAEEAAFLAIRPSPHTPDSPAAPLP